MPSLLRQPPRFLLKFRIQNLQSKIKKSPPPPRRLLLESLEAREVFNASFGSVTNSGSTGYDAAFDIATDTSGKVYSAGYFSGTVDFGPASAHAGDRDLRTATGELVPRGSAAPLLQGRTINEVTCGHCPLLPGTAEQ